MGRLGLAVGFAIDLSTGDGRNMRWPGTARSAGRWHQEVRHRRNYDTFATIGRKSMSHTVVVVADSSMTLRI